MQKKGYYLILGERDSVYMTLIMNTIVTIEKHFIEARNRSYLCKGEDCDFCHQQYPVRIRYQAQVIIDGETLTWEFGDELYHTIMNMSPVEGMLKLVVLKLGVGRKSRYQVRNQEDVAPIRNKYTNSRYGHLVRS